MLKTLVIDNLALIDHAEFDFQQGFICFTGETGAGKSVFLSALKLLTGQRGERMSLRPGTTQGKLEGLFSFIGPIIEKINACLVENDLPACEEGELILRRTFGDKQKISVNGSLTTLSVLKKLGNFWLEFHTPTEPQRLFDAETQIELLDKYAQLSTKKSEYSQIYTKYLEAKKQFQTLKDKAKLSPEMLEYIKKQLQVFTQLDLSEESIDQLEQDFKKLSQKEDCIQLLKEIDAIFNETPGLTEFLDKLQACLENLSLRLPKLQDLLQRYQQTRLELQDIESTCEQEQHGFDFDPEQCEAIQQNMQVWLELQRHYGNSLEQVLAAKNDLMEQVNTAENSEEKLQNLLNICQKLEAECRQKADGLHKLRAEKINSLNQLIIDCLKTLGFKKPKFSVELQLSDALNPHGLSKVQFLFSSDEALQALPLNHVASSGELSRILLAIKSTLHDVQEVPVIVFDEIDANVGGEVGQKVGILLKNLGNHAQVFCVTHLPQIAGQAQFHYCVTKQNENAIPTIKFNPLEDIKQRCEELARMLGDARSTSALQHAQTLLK